jgi:hypothetical protein
MSGIRWFPLLLALLIGGTSAAAVRLALLPDYCNCALGHSLNPFGELELACIGGCLGGDDCREEAYDVNWYHCDCVTSINACVCFGKRSADPQTPTTWTCYTQEHCSNAMDCITRDVAAFWQDACRCNGL